MKKIYLVMLLIISILVIQCCAKKQQVKEAASEEVIMDSDADGVADSEDVEMSAPDERVHMSKGGPEPEFERVEEMVVTGTSPIMKSMKPIQDTITIQKYELGRLVYSIPSEMEKLTTYHIIVNIARDTLDVRIYTEMSVVRVDTIIRTSKTMQVELLDPTGNFFKIVSDTERQFIEIDEHTTWNFYVTPLKSGMSELILNVSIIKDGNLKQKTYNDVVIVKTKPVLEIKLWLQKYWQWAFGIFIIPLFAYIKKKFFTKKS